MVGSAGTPAFAKAEKATVERAERAYRPAISDSRFVIVQNERTAGVARRATGRLSNGTRAGRRISTVKASLHHHPGRTDLVLSRLLQVELPKIRLNRQVDGYQSVESGNILTGRGIEVNKATIGLQIFPSTGLAIMK
jgi:hypothetical protein